MMRFTLELWPDMPDDGVNEPEDFLAYAVQSVKTNPTLAWDITHDDGSPWASDVKLPTRQRVDAVEAMLDTAMESWAGADVNELVGSEFLRGQMELIANLLPEVIGGDGTADRVEMLTARFKEKLKPREWTVPVEFVIGGDSAAEAVEHVRKLLNDAGYGHVVEPINEARPHSLTPGEAELQTLADEITFAKSVKDSLAERATFGGQALLRLREIEAEYGRTEASRNVFRRILIELLAMEPAKASVVAER